MLMTVAGLRVRYEPRHPGTVRYCERFLTPDDAGRPDIDIHIADADFNAAAAARPRESGSLREIGLLLEKLADELPEFDALFFHAAVVELDGRAYAFTARSGTGKSTHAALWREHFGGRARIINGDKPFFRRIDGVWYACGTPWGGKEGWYENAMVPLGAICFLEQGCVNRIVSLGEAEIIDRVFRQTVMPADPVRMEKYLSLLQSLIAATPCYLLSCDISGEAVRVASEGMIPSSRANAPGGTE